MKGVDHMDTNTELNDQMNTFENEVNPTTDPQKESVTNDELKEKIEDTLSKIRRQSMLLGCQVICQTIKDKIYAFESSHGKKSANDYKRLIKDIKKFCETGLSRKVNTDGETEPVETTAAETVQN
jgi:hypothetical protein